MASIALSAPRSAQLTSADRLLLTASRRLKRLALARIAHRRAAIAAASVAAASVDRRRDALAAGHVGLLPR
ncbi:hypothetical protein ACFQRL_07800 [Microbacterium fluvii]|uniref:Uncharacterized protein n=1 Tax=Microbacterium fluvii TaxID=415215 RepID=A0ABW2HC84_9MICO|nr:hypothetical protein [Microbacterium fluvii]MCU4672490.1 hypothetical protein [Microbacterium fluvii]